MKERHVLALLALLLPAGSAFAQEKQTADLVIVHGRVWTVDPTKPRAEAVAILGERIAAVGSNKEIGKWVGSRTRKIDARGKTVVPGFIDAHVHFRNSSAELSSVQLKDAKTPEEFARRIGEHAKTRPKGEWILGGNWDHENWPRATLPTREWIDRVAPDHPVFVSRYDGHMALANSVALRLAGITRYTQAPEGGEIVRDARGEPTGLLKDAAMDPVQRVIPEPSEEQRTHEIQAGLAEARRFGVTGMHDISEPADVRVYHKLAQRGELTARMYCITPIRNWEATVDAGLAAGFGDQWVRLGALKAVSDGSLGSTTALFFEPYNDAPGTSGLPGPIMFPDGNLLRIALGADKAGLQLAIHAIGDRANRVILETFAEVAKQNGPSAHRRFRIEHAQHVHPADFKKFAQVGVIASVQPYHAIDDGRWAEKRIGRERCKTTYAFRTFLDSGAKVAFGSDWSVAPLDPLWGIYAAVTRQTLDGKNPKGWFPEQKITLAEAIEAYTLGSAYAEFGEKEKGSLAVGKLADVVILDADLFAIRPERIKDAKVVATIVGGKVVYEAR